MGKWGRWCVLPATQYLSPARRLPTTTTTINVESEATVEEIEVSESSGITGVEMVERAASVGVVEDDILEHDAAQVYDSLRAETLEMGANAVDTEYFDIMACDAAHSTSSACGRECAAAGVRSSPQAGALRGASVR